MQDRVFLVGSTATPTALDRMREPAYPMMATCAQAFELWGAYSGWMINEIVGKGGNAKEAGAGADGGIPRAIVGERREHPGWGQAHL